MNPHPASLSLNTMLRILPCLLLLALSPLATSAEHSDARAIYIANMGAMIERGDTKVLFDPLFRNDFGIYDPVPAEIERALLAGIEPWDGIDAIFVSHYHEDHFDPAALMLLLRAQPGIELFAPEQAAAALRELATDCDVLERIHGLALANGEIAIDIDFFPLLIEAVRIPHAGWPDRHAHVENIVFRVTLDDDTTVMHLGDADPARKFYAGQSGYWRERHTHFAMPPYWFFLSDAGRDVLEDHIKAAHAVGMHVPNEIPGDRSDRQAELQDVDLFTTPGEIREIVVGDE